MSSTGSTLLRNALVYILILTAATALAQDGPAGVVESLLVESADGTMIEGQLDWTGSTLTVTGEAVAPETVTNPVQRRLMGFRAAKVSALRSLLEALGGVQVDSRTTVSMAMVTSDSIRSRVEGLVRGARVVPGSRREVDGLYTLDIRVDLLGELTDAVLPDTATTRSSLAASLPDRDSVIVFVPEEPFTGLVVDARGTSLRPSMSPRIVDDSGRLIYAADHVDRAYAVGTGVVGYARDLHSAVTSDRVGGERAHAYIAEMVGISGLYNSDVVVTRDAGTRILMADMAGDFLNACRVVFVVGPKPEPTPEPLVPFSSPFTPDTLLPTPPHRDFLDSVIEARSLSETLDDSLAGAPE